MFVNKTIQLKKELDERQSKFLDLKVTKESFDFYLNVKPAFDLFEKEVEEWYQLSHDAKVSMKYINEELLFRTKAQMLELFIQSYHYSTSKKMFLQLKKTIDYCLDTIIDTKI